MKEACGIVAACSCPLRGNLIDPRARRRVRGLIIAHIGLGHTPWIAAVVTLGAFALTAFSGRLDQRDSLSERTAEPAELTR